MITTNQVLEHIQSLGKQEAREFAVSILLNSIGEDCNREGLIDTPKRVAKMYEEIFCGYGQDPEQILLKSFAEDKYGEASGDIVLVSPIPFYSHCEHHMVPFHGAAHVAYIPEPGNGVVGISKLARLVECFARRLQIQERMTKQIADTINEVLNPKGVAVMIEAEHMCMTMRGVKKPGTKTKTAAMRGVFMDEPAARAEFYQLIGGNK